MSIHNLCFEQKYDKYQNFLSENFQFLVVKFSVCLNRHVSVSESGQFQDYLRGLETPHRFAAFLTREIGVHSKRKEFATLVRRDAKQFEELPAFNV